MTELQYESVILAIRYFSTNKPLSQVELYLTTPTEFTEIFSRELRKKHNVENPVFLLDGDSHLQTAIQQSTFRHHIDHYRNQNAVEKFSRKLKRRIIWLENCFSNVDSYIAESSFQTFACWYKASSKNTIKIKNIPMEDYCVE
jgi:putative transposase